MPLLADQPKRTSWSEIVIAVKQRLVDEEVLGEDLIKIIARRDADRIPAIQAEKLLFIRPGRFASPRKQNDGEGRVAARVYRLLQILVVDRTALDPVDDDEILLTDEDVGIIPLEESVVDALDMHMLEDDSRNALLFEDMRMLTGSEVDKMRRPFWADSAIQFEVGYLFNATNPLGLNT